MISIFLFGLTCWFSKLYLWCGLFNLPYLYQQNDSPVLKFGRTCSGPLFRATPRLCLHTKLEAEYRSWSIVRSGQSAESRLHSSMKLIKQIGKPLLMSIGRDLLASCVIYKQLSVRGIQYTSACVNVFLETCAYWRKQINERLPAT